MQSEQARYDRAVHYLGLATQAASGGRPQDAATAAQRLIALQPSWPHGYQLLAEAYEDLGDLHRARHAFEQGLTHGLELATGTSNLLISFGLFESRRRCYDEAERRF